jgi:integrase/recombinase XerD
MATGTSRPSSENLGQNRPRSSRLVHMAKPLRSQYTIRTRSQRLEKKMNRCPLNGYVSRYISVVLWRAIICDVNDERLESFRREFQIRGDTYFSCPACPLCYTAGLVLEKYFKYPGVLQRMRRGPLAVVIDDIAADLERAGYARGSARRYLSLIATFSRYALEKGDIRNGMVVDRALVERFLQETELSVSTVIVARSALGHVVRAVAERNPCSGRTIAAEGRESKLLIGFDSYLRDLKGLVPKSREAILRAARRMIAWHRRTKPRQPLGRLSVKDVLACAADIAERYACHRTRSKAMTCLRGFLRYLRWSGVCRDDLSRYVPRVPIWRAATLPDHLAWEDVRRLIASIDVSVHAGRRDRALLLLVATTGMRNGEIRRLHLGDVRWRRGEILLRRTKNRRERAVPLLQETGRALADYILRARPRVADRHIFLTHRPPFRHFRVSSGVSALVRRHLGRLGVRTRWGGAHLLRHSLATQMVRQERPIKEVSDLLGHQSIEATSVYVKVALPQLASCALPFPSEA